MTRKKRALVEAPGAYFVSGPIDLAGALPGQSTHAFIPRFGFFARTLLLPPFLMLVACGGTSKSQNAEAATGDDIRIACALGGTADFKPACTIDRIEGAEGLTLVVHNTDGGFHRLRVTTDGRGVIAADGAERARVTIAGANEIEVAIGNDRYRLPATIKGAAS